LKEALRALPDDADAAAAGARAVQLRTMQYSTDARFLLGGHAIWQYSGQHNASILTDIRSFR